MKGNLSRLWSSSRFAVALGVSLAIATGAGCAVSPDEPAVSEPEPTIEATAQSSTVPGANFQFVFQCFTPDGGRIGFPKSPLSACQAACPAPNRCVLCTFNRGAVECPEP